MTISWEELLIMMERGLLPDLSLEADDELRDAMIEYTNLMNRLDELQDKAASKAQIQKCDDDDLLR